jgi:hypothetical protein
VTGELLRCETEFAVGHFAIAALLVVVIGVNDELAFYGNSLVFRIVEVDAAAEAANRRFARFIEHGRAPKHGQPSGHGILAFFDPRLAKAEPALPVVSIYLATNRSNH